MPSTRMEQAEPSGLRGQLAQAGDSGCGAVDTGVVSSDQGIGLSFSCYLWICLAHSRPMPSAHSPAPVPSLDHQQVPGRQDRGGMSLALAAVLTAFIRLKDASSQGRKLSILGPLLHGGGPLHCPVQMPQSYRGLSGSIGLRAMRMHRSLSNIVLLHGSATIRVGTFDF